MRKPYLTAIGTSNSPLETSFRGRGKVFPINFAVVRISRALWPRKTDIELAARTGASDRVCRNWIALRCGVSLDAFVALLQTEEGLLYLEGVMGEAKPAWWRRFKRSVRLSTLRANYEKARKEIEQLELRFDE